MGAQAPQTTDADPRYAYLDADERARMVTILRETQRELREAFEQMASATHVELLRRWTRRLCLG